MSNAVATQDLTTMTPAEIDTILADIWGRQNNLIAEIKGYEKKARSAKKCIAQGYTGYQSVLDNAVAKVAELQAQMPAIEAEAAPFEAEFTRRGGWTRAFLCTANDGHVHKDRACSTTRLTTKFMWLIDFAGKDEEEVVAAAGCIACTVCFPSAPVSVLAQATTIFASPEAKAKAEKKAAAEASKCKGSLTFNYDRSTARLGYCAGNAATCDDCGQRITVTSSYALRTHQAK